MLRTELEKQGFPLDTLEKTKQYKDILKLTKKVLLEQWVEVLYSGAIVSVYDLYNKLFKDRQISETKKSITKAITEEDEEEDDEGEEGVEEGEEETKQKPKEKQTKNMIPIIGGMVGLSYLLNQRVKDIVKDNVYSSGKYFQYKPEMQNYLKYAMNMGGQNIIDSISSGQNIKFRLANEYYKQKIVERVNNLIKTVDQTTKDTISRQLILGLDKKETKKELVNRLLKTGKDMSEYRARRIVETESTAALEYMRHETARMNGATIKEWVATTDEKTCLTGFATSVKCIDGWKKIGEIQVGDYVLTHKDRYKKVIRTMCRKHNGKLITIDTGLKNKLAGAKNISLCTTPEHPYLTNRGWVKAEDITLNDKLYILAKKCNLPQCINEVFHTRKFCSNKCRMKSLNDKIWSDPKQHERVIKENKKHQKALKLKQGLKNWLNNPQNKIYFSNNISKALLEKYKDTQYKNRLVSIVLQNFKSMRSKKGYAPSIYEDRMKKILSSMGINYIYQYEVITKITTRWVDFYIPDYNLIVEIDGKEHTPNKDRDRDLEIKEVMNNSFILHIPNIFFLEKDISKVVNILQTNFEMGCFLEVAIKNISIREKLKKHQMVYNLEVEEDSSYVAKGLIVHNCDICGDLHGMQVPMNENFPIVDISTGPAHPNCRCEVDYIFTEASELINRNFDIYNQIELFMKSNLPQKDYKSNIEINNSVLNPNALWAGGESLIGKDKEVGNYYEKLKSDEKNKFSTIKLIFRDLKWKQLDQFAKYIIELSNKYDKSILIDTGELRKYLKAELDNTDWTSKKLLLSNDYALILIQARAKLTAEGFAQLLIKLGIKNIKVPLLD